MKNLSEQTLLTSNRRKVNNIIIQRAERSLEAAKIQAYSLLVSDHFVLTLVMIKGKYTLVMMGGGHKVPPY